MIENKALWQGLVIRHDVKLPPLLEVSEISDCIDDLKTLEPLLRMLGESHPVKVIKLLNNADIQRRCVRHDSSQCILVATAAPRTGTLAAVRVAVAVSFHWRRPETALLHHKWSVRRCKRRAQATIKCRINFSRPRNYLVSEVCMHDSLILGREWLNIFRCGSVARELRYRCDENSFSALTTRRVD